MYQPLVILASSRKNGGICLAGKRLGQGAAAWVRPVSIQAGQAWTQKSLGKLVGGVPQVGDRVMLPLTRALPQGYQRENCSVGFARWHRAGRAETADLLRLVETPATLWLNGWHCVHGWNDRIPHTVALSQCESSLALIRPDTLRFRIHQHYGDLTVRAEFDYRGEHYDLRITDDAVCSDWIERLAYGHDGKADALLCISLGQPHLGYCYKLVAGVVELGAEGRP